MSVISTKNVGEKMSKLIVREKLRDYFKHRVTAEEAVEIKDALKSMYGFIIDIHPFAMAFIVRYSHGYTVDEISEMFGIERAEVVRVMQVAYAILGDVLELDDASVVRKAPLILRQTAADILAKIYEEFREL
jgi:hypothetical protein